MRPVCFIALLRSMGRRAAKGGGRFSWTHTYDPVLHGSAREIVDRRRFSCTSPTRSAEKFARWKLQKLPTIAISRRGNRRSSLVRLSTVFRFHPLNNICILTHAHTAIYLAYLCIYFLYVYVFLYNKNALAFFLSCGVCCCPYIN